MKCKDTERREPLDPCSIYNVLTPCYHSVVKLTKNWRSHNVILRFPSDEFYNGELEACGDPAITHSLQSYHKLKRCGNPVIFHGICGTDRRERNSPSYFNIEEASLVKEYVQDLLEERQFGLSMNYRLFFALS